jgi:hypothetical protein
VSRPEWLKEDTGSAAERAATIPADRAELVARLTELVGVLDYAELTDLSSVAGALGRHHGRPWGEKGAR